MTRLPLLALLVSLQFGLLGSAVAAESVEVTRLAGEDRYATAARIAEETFSPDGYTNVVLARGDAFPDALSAANLLDPDRRESILLTTFDRLPQATVDAITRHRVVSVRILGGNAVISPAVELQLRDLGVKLIDRVAGRDRYETNAATFTAGGKYTFESHQPAFVDGKRSALLTSGLEFADAMSAASLSLAEYLPLYLTDPRFTPDPVLAALSYDDGAAYVDQVFIVGGIAAVSQAVEERLLGLGFEVHRIAGTTRQGTAVELAEFARRHFGWSYTHVNLARGDAFPDTVTAAPHAGRERAPTLLTVSIDELGAVTRQALADNADVIESLHVYGDRTAVSDAAVGEAREAATR